MASWIIYAYKNKQAITTLQHNLLMQQSIWFYRSVVWPVVQIVWLCGSSVWIELYNLFLQIYLVVVSLLTDVLSYFFIFFRVTWEWILILFMWYFFYFTYFITRWFMGLLLFLLQVSWCISPLGFLKINIFFITLDS